MAQIDIRLSLFVHMQDGSAPNPGPGDGTGHDFAIDLEGIAPAAYLVSEDRPGVYLVSTTVRINRGCQTGVVRGAGHSGKAFQVTGFQSELLTSPPVYQKTRDTRLAATTLVALDYIFVHCNRLVPSEPSLLRLAIKEGVESGSMSGLAHAIHFADGAAARSAGMEPI